LKFGLQNLGFGGNLISRHFKFFQITDSVWQAMISLGKIGNKQFNAYTHYKVDRFLKGYGLAVSEKHRCRGIATELLKARIPLLKALSLTLTTTAFTSDGSAMAAEKAGYTENLRIA
jgi:hypothetical protein